MNTQLKFRIWDITQKRWLEQFRDNESGMIEWDTNDGYMACPLSLDNLINNKNFIVQQWTGMTDRNNVDVYDGDIVAEKHDGGECEANIGRVFFTAGTFIIDGDGPLYNRTYSESPEILEDYLVIGNVKQTPELV